MNGRLRARLAKTFSAIFEDSTSIDIIAVDMPIGLNTRYVPGGRECERNARKLLRSPKSSSVFSAPARPVLEAKSYEEACRLSRGSTPGAKAISRQTYGILPKIKEIDEFLRSRPELRAIVREVHPEVCFAELAGAPMKHGKKTPAGRTERRRALRAVFDDVETLIAMRRQAGLPQEDLLDAAAACWTALRIARGEGRSLVTPIPRDATDLPMTIWV